MKIVLRYLTGLAIVGLLALLSWLTIPSDGPEVFAPLNFLVFAPILMTADSLPRACIYIGVAVVPIFFCIWCWPLLRGGPTLPKRSIVLLVVSVSLSVATLLFGARYGLKYQSGGYVLGVTVINMCCWALVVALAVLARRRPSFWGNLGFHTALFAWLAWCAFPYLGELP